MIKRRDEQILWRHQEDFNLKKEYAIKILSNYPGSWAAIYAIAETKNP